jgi:hypothetical protein
MANSSHPPKQTHRKSERKKIIIIKKARGFIQSASNSRNLGWFWGWEGSRTMKHGVSYTLAAVHVGADSSEPRTESRTQLPRIERPWVTPSHPPCTTLSPQNCQKRRHSATSLRGLQSKTRVTQDTRLCLRAAPVHNAKGMTHSKQHTLQYHLAH